ncbi:MAG: hypothetical protein KGL51_03825 [Betaproteobacteria bacterium]|nr:hypothetical protein [Betaproteobacteria bacterium]MDE2323786.1 hypothetical protein [Betaproteobacteria bacterium]
MMPIQPSSSSPPSWLSRRLAALRDILLVLFWTDSPAGHRVRLELQRRFARRGQSPQGARRMAGLRLAAALGITTLFAPWLVLAAALGSAALLSHAPGMSRACLLLAFALVGLYGRGILHLGRDDAWRKSVFRASGHDLQALPQESALKRLQPEALGGEALRHWRCARRWAWVTVALLAGLAWSLARGVGWILAHRPAHGCRALPWMLGAALGLALWLPTRYDHHVGLALGLSLDAPEAAETAQTAEAVQAPQDAAR